MKQRIIIIMIIIMITVSDDDDDDDDDDVRGLPQLFSALRLSGIRKHSGDFVNHSLYTRPSVVRADTHPTSATGLSSPVPGRARIRAEAAASRSPLQPTASACLR